MMQSASCVHRQRCGAQGYHAVPMLLPCQPPLSASLCSSKRSRHDLLARAAVLVQAAQQALNADGWVPSTTPDPNAALMAALPSAENVRVKSSEYITSAVNHKDCPAPRFPEFAVIGRSNVGKSSLINMVTNSKRLAHVSKEPGKTRCINHFLINGNWYLVDLPGYGYARTGSAARDQFDTFTKDYFLHRPNLALVYLLVDSSIEPQPIDLEYAVWLHANKVPHALVWTKADKRKKGQPARQDNVAAFKQALLEQYGLPSLPPCVVTSAESGIGRTQLLHLTATRRDECISSHRIEHAMSQWQTDQLAKKERDAGAMGRRGPAGEGESQPGGATKVKSGGSEELEALPQWKVKPPAAVRKVYVIPHASD